LPLFPPAGRRQPTKGEKTRPDPGYARMQNMALIGPRVAEKSLTEQTNKHTVKQIPRFSLSERMAGNNPIKYATTLSSEEKKPRTLNIPDLVVAFCVVTMLQC